ncbi:AfsR/SARP family transcriptional regulator [Desulfoluna butyratoxydans]|uniref:Bacterial transcriptional activator domain n=1 Tax=Desulfoluna butyratoxydans TaxID=231438 RepID=A0A4U8YVD5_9BACT|nr:BTAD domain-containing putative transcriptional regulator [Desulfoluna butyratoxydans]VFQ45902.1 bacterial transcriptional activator domain [Desulfoluna butyratoxydans]
MTMLHIHCFGVPRFTVDTEPVRIPRRKSAALAVYLAVTGRAHTREKLADLLWPDQEQDKGRASLRRALSDITRTLGRSWLAADRETIGALASDLVQVDVTRFRTLLGMGRTGSLSAMEEALSLYTGSFLSGFHLNGAPDFDHWRLEQAERLDREAAEIMKALSERYMTLGKKGEALEVARRLAALDPLDEEAHRRLMDLFVQAGRRDAALRQYETCRALLRTELAVDPDQETEALADAIRSHQKPVKKQKPNLPISNLPAQATAFVGRAGEVTGLVERITSPEVRLLTLTGPGGMGKTRLALQVASLTADRFAHGVFFISLADLDAKEALVRELIRVFGLSEGETAHPMGRIADFLRPKKILLLLDNCEHLPEGALVAAELLEAAPHLTILATSRTRLMLKGEHLFALSGLSHPDIAKKAPDGEDLKNAETTYDALALFLATARMVNPDTELTSSNYPALAQICDMTAGMPLALILAAGWMDTLTPSDIAGEIRNNLDFLNAKMQDLPPRHRSMRAVFDSSWKRLTEKEKTALQRLTVFRDGFTLDAVAKVTGMDKGAAAETTASLARKSILRADPETGRFGIHPLLRQYTDDHLGDPGHGHPMEDAHMGYYLALVQSREKELTSRDMPACRRAMDADMANIRQAWLRAAATGALDALGRSATGLYAYFDMHTRYHEGEALFRPAKECVMDASSNRPDARLCLVLLCWFDMQTQGFPPKNQENAPCPGDEEARVERVARNTLRQAVSTGDIRGRAWAFLLLGALAHRRKRHGQAIRLFRLSLTAHPGIEHAFWVSLRIGLCLRSLGRIGEAIDRFRASHQWATRTGDHIKTAWAMGNIGSAALCLGDLHTAETCLKEAATAFRKLNAPIGMVISCEELGLIAFLKGDLEQAAALAEEALGVARASGFARARYQRAQALKGLILVASGSTDKARPCLEAVLETGLSRFSAHLAMVFCACRAKDRETATTHLAQAHQLAPKVHKTHLLLLLTLAQASVSALSEDHDEATHHLNQARHHPGFDAGLFQAWSMGTES